MSSTARADVAQGTTAAHAGAATAHGTAASHLATGPAAAHPHPPPPPPTATLETTHLQEEAGDKLLEAGGAYARLYAAQFAQAMAEVE